VEGSCEYGDEPSGYGATELVRLVLSITKIDLKCSCDNEVQYLD
jgi:hypothetical protein